MVIIDIRNIDVIFGKDKDKKKAQSLLKIGKSRTEILAQTNAVLGIANVSLSVEKGHICVLMGLSGSGKSTLLRCINGLNPVTNGELIIKDQDGDTDIVKTDYKTLRQLRMNKISMVFQQFALLPWKTVRENIGFGLELKKLTRAKIDQIIDDKLELVNLTNWGDKKGSELSGGMQQRVGLARALATDAEILLMDEPFSALDPLTRTYLQDELLDLQRKLKKTIVFVSHDLDEALKLGNKIVIMDEGKIVQQGDPVDIVFRPANNYVREFVSNINPLRALYAAVVMLPLKQLNQSEQGIVIPFSEKELTIMLTSSGDLSSVTDGDDDLKLLPIEQTLDDGNNDDPKASVLLADVNTDMPALISGTRNYQYPILVTEQSKFVGVIREKEIYDGLLRQCS